MLIEVTLCTIEPLFKLLILSDFRKNVGPVVFHMLVKGRNTLEVCEKIFPHTMPIAQFLFKENSEESLMYLNKLAKFCESVKDYYPTYALVSEKMKPLLRPQKCEFNVYKEEKLWPVSSEIIEEIVVSRDKKVGLKNLNNTCYLNSVLQALYMTKSFRNNMLMLDHSGMPLFHEVQGLFALLQYSNKSVVSPNSIVHIARPGGFTTGVQHDSSEFLLHLLDLLHEQEVAEMNEPINANGKCIFSQFEFLVIQIL